MYYLNEVRLIGRATRDAEFKEIGKDSKLATFRLVSNRRIKKRDGTFGEKATFVDCEVWGQRAEYARDNVKKGSPVLIAGQLETDEWEKDGQKRSKLKIYCNSVQVDRPKSQNTSEDDASSEAQPVAAAGASVAASDDPPF